MDLYECEFEEDISEEEQGSLAYLKARNYETCEKCNHLEDGFCTFYKKKVKGRDGICRPYYDCNFDAYPHVLKKW